jgi:hypothetical protein
LWLALKASCSALKVSVLYSSSNCSPLARVRVMVRVRVRVRVRIR